MFKKIKEYISKIWYKKLVAELHYLRKENQLLREDLIDERNNKAVIPPVLLGSETEGNSIKITEGDINNIRQELKSCPYVMEFFSKILLQKRNEQVMIACSNYVSEDNRMLARATIEAYYDIYAQWITCKPKDN
jgi:hypothetical protein